MKFKFKLSGEFECNGRRRRGRRKRRWLIGTVIVLVGGANWLHGDEPQIHATLYAKALASKFEGGLEFSRR